MLLWCRDFYDELIDLWCLLDGLEGTLDVLRNPTNFNDGPKVTSRDSELSCKANYG